MVALIFQRPPFLHDRWRGDVRFDPETRCRRSYVLITSGIGSARPTILFD